MFKQMFMGGAASMFYIFALLVSSLVQSSLAIRFLSASDAGVWFVFLSISTFAAISDFGLSPTMSREIGFKSGGKEGAINSSDLVRTVKLLLLMISSMVVVLGVAGGVVYVFAKGGVVFHSNIIIAYFIFIFGLGAKLYANGNLAILYGFRYVAYERLLRGFSPLFGVIVAYLMLLFGYGLIGMTIAYLMQTLMLNVTAFLCCKWRVSDFFTKTATFRFAIVKRLFPSCWQWTLVALGTLVFQLNNPIIAYFKGVKLVPNYSIPQQVASFIVTVALLFQYVAYPFMSTLYAEKKTAEVRDLFFRCIKFALAFSVASAVFLLTFKDSITAVWLGHTFVIDYYVMLIILITCVLQIVHSTAAGLSIATGFIWFARPSVLSGIFTIIFSALLCYRFGVIGAALGSFFAQLVTNNWYIVFVSLKHFKISFRMFLVNCIYQVLILFILLFPCALLIRYYVAKLVSLDIQELFLGGCIVALVALVVIYYVVLSSIERGWVTEKVRFFMCKVHG